MNSKVVAYYARLAAGQQDVGSEDGQELPFWYRFQNWRPGPDGSIVRRGGMQRFSKVTRADQAADFNGSANFLVANLDVRTHALKKYWTVEALCKPDTFTNARPVLDFDHASDYSIRGPYFTTAGLIEAKVQDSAGTVTTLTSATTYATGTTCAIQVMRNGTSLSLKVNGATEDSDTMADLDCKTPAGSLLIGKSQAGTFFDGVIDFVRCLSIPLPDQRYGFIRWPYPRAEPVLWDYDVEESTTTATYYDYSRFENHAIASSAPTSSGANVLCVSHTPIFGIAEWLDRDAKQRMFLAAGAGYVLQEVVR